MPADPSWAGKGRERLLSKLGEEWLGDCGGEGLPSSHSGYVFLGVSNPPHPMFLPACLSVAFFLPRCLFFSSLSFIKLSLQLCNVLGTLPLCFLPSPGLLPIPCSPLLSLLVSHPFLPPSFLLSHELCDRQHQKLLRKGRNNLGGASCLPKVGLVAAWASGLGWAGLG